MNCSEIETCSVFEKSTYTLSSVLHVVHQKPDIKSPLIKLNLM